MADIANTITPWAQDFARRSTWSAYLRAQAAMTLCQELATPDGIVTLGDWGLANEKSADALSEFRDTPIIAFASDTVQDVENFGSLDLSSDMIQRTNLWKKAEIETQYHFMYQSLSPASQWQWKAYIDRLRRSGAWFMLKLALTFYCSFRRIGLTQTQWTAAKALAAKGAAIDGGWGVYAKLTSLVLSFDGYLPVAQINGELYGTIKNIQAASQKLRVHQNTITSRAFMDPWRPSLSSRPRTKKA